MRAGILIVQTITFIALGIWFITNHEIRLGLAQLFLAAVQALIYS